jgi:caffeoyl-CoA O-methyltransferase
MVHRQGGWIDGAIADYIAERARPQPDAVLADLRTETAALGDRARMQIGADQGALLTALTRLTAAAFAVEVGTFTGYSSICIARGLRPGGRLLCCDVSEEYTAVARAAWERAGLTERIELRLGPAVETLAELPADTVIDIAFVDADKGNYRNYYEALLPHVREGGLVLADNTLWSGHVADADADADDDNLAALRAFNDHVAADDRVDSFVLPVGDGLTLIVKH